MIYIAHGFGLEQLVSALQPWLHAGELRHARGYTSTERQRHYLVGRGLLRWLACTATDAAEGSVSIHRQPNGAPALSIEDAQVTCSISHKNDAVMVAMGEAEALGIDIEQVQQRQRQRELIATFRDGFMQGIKEDDLVGFYQRWTLAESVTKAQQGKLLPTLHTSHEAYVKDAVFYTAENYMLCCYAQHRQDTTANDYRWWQVKVTEQQALEAKRLNL